MLIIAKFSANWSRDLESLKQFSHFVDHLRPKFKVIRVPLDDADPLD